MQRLELPMGIRLAVLGAEGHGAEANPGDLEIAAAKHRVLHRTGRRQGHHQDSKKDGKKLIVEELTIRGAKAEASAAFMNGKTVTVPLPDITMRNLGKTRGGITPGELGQEVAKALIAKLGSAVNFEGLLKSTEGAAGKAGAAVKGLFK
jgi:hypothetical protein